MQFYAEPVSAMAWLLGLLVTAGERHSLQRTSMQDSFSLGLGAGVTSLQCKSVQYIVSHGLAAGVTCLK